MPIQQVAEPAWSGAIRRAKPGEGELVSRSASEPDSASLCKLRAAKLPYVTKPATGGEAKGNSKHRALRGGWGRRMGKDQSRNLGDPAKRSFFLATNVRGECITLGRLGRESDRLIVCAEQHVVQEG